MFSLNGFSIHASFSSVVVISFLGNKIVIEFNVHHLLLVSSMVRRSFNLDSAWSSLSNK